MSELYENFTAYKGYIIEKWEKNQENTGEKNELKKVNDIECDVS